MRSWLCVLFALGLVACDGEAPGLFIDLKTDYVVGRQLSGIRTLVLRRADTEEPTPLAREDYVASTTDDFLGGVRIAELQELPQGPLIVRVVLLGPSGDVVDARDTAVDFGGPRVITVLMTGSCRGVVCPDAGDDPGWTACVGGRCVDPRCAVEEPEFCGAFGCASNAECTSAIACGQPVCIDRECFVAARDDRCGASEICDPREGCVLRAGADAGPGCPPTETSCTDGLDDDCDGDTDCADADCLDVACDDASACTVDEVCRADGTCGADPIDCDDADPCTDDDCDPASGCTHTDNTASCDDGFWCNGADTCREGLCQDHGAPPCPAFCNEMAMACEECMVDGDCGNVSYGSWGTCGGFGGTCDETGTQSRSVMTPTCSAGTCTVVTTSQSRGCTRDRENVTCGSTTYSGWSSCGGFSGACDTTGSQTRTRTRRLCRSASCTNVANQESRGCSRSVSNGTACGGGNVCCSGSCVSISTNARCGGCDVSCSAIGRTCAATGTGGYSCRSCTSNAECQSIMNGAATCWDIAAPPTFCQCQCPSNGVCANGGCGAGFFCHDCPGHNFCSASGGSC